MRLSFIFFVALFGTVLSLRLRGFSRQTGALCPNPSPQKLQTCTWYDDSTCCTPGDDLDSIAGFFNEFRDTSLEGPCGEQTVEDGCIDQLTLFMCFGCSPDADSYVSTNPPGFRVCERFANKLYNGCKNLVLPTESGCRKVGDQYRNGEEFLQSLLDFEDEEDVDFSLIITKDDCFNSAVGLSAFPLGVLAALLISSLL